MFVGFKPVCEFSRPDTHLCGEGQKDHEDPVQAAWGQEEEEEKDNQILATLALCSHGN